MFEDAVLEAPELEVADLGEQGEESGEQELVEEELEAGAEGEGEPAGDGRKIPAYIRAMKESNPEAYRLAKADFFKGQSLSERVAKFGPEGVKELDAVASFLEEHGGREGLATRLTELAASAQELTGISQGVAAGDPKVIDRFMADSPDGFNKLAPVVLDRWAQSDPDGFSRSMSGIIASTIEGARIPAFLERMELLLEYGKTEDVKAALQQLGAWTKGFSTRAAAPVKPREGQGQPNKLDEREQGLNQRETAIFRSDVARDVTSFRGSEITKGLASFIAKDPKDAEKKELAIETVRNKVTARLSADKGYQDKLNDLEARRDKEGMLRLLKSREAEAIKEIAPKVGRTFYGQVAAAAAVVKPPVVKLKPGTTAAPKRATEKFDEIWNS